MPTARRRILCVEDHDDTRSMLTLLLEREGYYVIAVENAAPGLALAQTQTFDRLILDVWLPDDDGLKLCRRVREFDHYTPGHADRHLHGRSARVGQDGRDGCRGRRLRRQACRRQADRDGQVRARVSLLQAMTFG